MAPTLPLGEAPRRERPAGEPGLPEGCRRGGPAAWQRWNARWPRTPGQGRPALRPVASNPWDWGRPLVRLQRLVRGPHHGPAGAGARPLPSVPSPPSGTRGSKRPIFRQMLLRVPLKLARGGGRCASSGSGKRVLAASAVPPPCPRLLPRASPGAEGPAHAEGTQPGDLPSRPTAMNRPDSPSRGQEDDQTARLLGGTSSALSNTSASHGGSRRASSACGTGRGRWARRWREPAGACASPAFVCPSLLPPLTSR
jgi:hypothetical protein